MKCIRIILLTVTAAISSAAFSQSRNEMPLTSASPEAVKLLRNAWVAYGDADLEKANGFVLAALEKDPEFGMAHAFINTSNQEDQKRNLEKASTSRLSPDEKLLIEGFRNAQNNESPTMYFQPLMQKYPKDPYLNLWIMFNSKDLKTRQEIGEAIIKRNPKFAPAYNLLGYAQMAQKDLTNAETNFNKYLSLRPDLANAYDSKGDYLMRAGKITEAIAMYEKAASMGMVAAKRRAELAAAMAKNPAPSEADKQQITDIIAASCQAFLNSDVNAVLKAYSDQAIELFPNQMVNAGPGNIRVRLEQTFRFGSFTKFERTIQSIQGAGPIALAWVKTSNTFKSSSGNLNDNQVDNIFMFRKQQSGEWKILAHHSFVVNNDINGKPSDNPLAVKEVVDKWNFLIKPGEVLSQQHVDNLAAIHSEQGVDIRFDQRSIIGMANLRLLWEGFKGIKWEQFTGYNFDINSFALMGPEGFERKAIAWGIGDHSNSPPGSDEVSQFLFPYAMILTKEKDDQWRILVYHFALE